MQPINEMKIRIEAETAAELVEIFGEDEAAPYIAEYSNFMEMAAMLLDAEEEAKTQEAALKEQIQARQLRAKRFSDRQARLRVILQQMMITAGQRKLELPQGTVSIMAARPKLIIDEEALSDDWMRIKKEPDKTAIKQAIDSGNEVPGAVMSNGGETITIRRS